MSGANEAQVRGIALVTGANRGLGFEVARVLATRGYTVWLGARDVEKGSIAAERLVAEGGDVRPLQLDVTDGGSVQAAAERVAREHGRLDVLVNNAGIAIDGGIMPSKQEMQRVQAMFETNLFGSIRVTQAFIPLLRKSPAGRVVMVSSDIGSHGRQTDPGFHGYALNPIGYAASKSALNAVTIAFSKELAGLAIKVNAANPGYTATDLNGFQGMLTVEQGAMPIVTLATLPQDGPTGTFWGPDGTLVTVVR